MTAVRTKTLASLVLFALGLFFRDRLVAQTNSQECSTVCSAGCKALQPGCKIYEYNFGWNGSTCSCSGCKCLT
jgi:hypothetical protein